MTRKWKQYLLWHSQIFYQTLRISMNNNNKLEFINIWNNYPVSSSGLADPLTPLLPHSPCAICCLAAFRRSSRAISPITISERWSLDVARCRTLCSGSARSEISMATVPPQQADAEPFSISMTTASRAPWQRGLTGGRGFLGGEGGLGWVAGLVGEQCGYLTS